MNIFITGVTSGFGRQIAIDCIKNGFTVIGTGRRKNKLDDLKNELGDNFMPLCFDIGDMSATKTALQPLPNDILAGIAVLSNNAGLA